MNEPHDMAELAEACVAYGLIAAATSRGFLLGVPGRRKRCRWRGTQEHGWLLVILRDAVCAVLPGSYCAPTLIDPDADHDGPRCVIPRDADMRFPKGVPMLVYGRTETECWARALVLLFRAGLIGEGPCSKS